MSLINDALKKAQNIQTRPAGATATFPRPNAPTTPQPATANPVPAAAAPTPVTAPPPVRASKPAATGLIIGIASTVLVVALGAIGYVAYALFFMGSPEDQIAASAPATAIAPQAQPRPVTPAPVTETPAVTDSTVPTATPVEPPPSTKTEPAVSTPSTAPVATAPTVVNTPAVTAPTPVAVGPQPVVATPPPVAATPPPPAPAPVPVVEEPEERINHPAPHIQAWVDKINVAGIRAGDGAKALMNDRVYLVGDVVNREFDLRLITISNRQLVFEDVEGNTYEYTF